MDIVSFFAKPPAPTASPTADPASKAGGGEEAPAATPQTALLSKTESKLPVQPASEAKQQPRASVAEEPSKVDGEPTFDMMLVAQIEAAAKAKLAAEKLATKHKASSSGDDEKKPSQPAAKRHRSELKLSAATKKSDMKAGQKSFFQMHSSAQIQAALIPATASSEQPAAAPLTFAQRAKAQHDAKTAGDSINAGSLVLDKEAEKDRMRREAFERMEARKRKLDEETAAKEAAQAAAAAAREAEKQAAKQAAAAEKARVAEEKKIAAELKRIEREAAKLDKTQKAEAKKRQKQEAQKAAEARAKNPKPAAKGTAAKASKPVKKKRRRAASVVEPPPELPPMVRKLQSVLKEVMKVQHEWPFAESKPEDDALPLATKDNEVLAKKLSRNQVRLLHLADPPRVEIIQVG
eukprot:SAG31_NODE_198_length_20656_cov_5.167291_3_plen_407_part_00